MQGLHQSFALAPKSPRQAPPKDPRRRLEWLQASIAIAIGSSATCSHGSTHGVQEVLSGLLHPAGHWSRSAELHVCRSGWLVLASRQSGVMSASAQGPVSRSRRRSKSPAGRSSRASSEPGCGSAASGASGCRGFAKGAPWREAAPRCCGLVVDLPQAALRRRRTLEL